MRIVILGLLLAASPLALAIQVAPGSRPNAGQPNAAGNDRLTCETVTTIYSTKPQQVCLTAGQRASAAAEVANRRATGADRIDGRNCERGRACPSTK